MQLGEIWETAGNIISAQLGWCAKRDR